MADRKKQSTTFDFSHTFPKRPASSSLYLEADATPSLCCTAGVNPLGLNGRHKPRPL